MYLNGYADFKRDFRRTLKANAIVTENMLDHLVGTRNEIAHGDYSVTKTPADVSNMSQIIETCCKTMDKIFADWWAKKYCSIR